MSYLSSASCMSRAARRVAQSGAKQRFGLPFNSLTKMPSRTSKGNPLHVHMRHASSQTVGAELSLPRGHRAVAYWLMGTGGLVVGMVLVGGITRLTRSGLSMTDWKIYGSLPPLSREQWEAEFERYKQFPEWQQRKSMTLDEFKFIYYWEYGHRQLGRVLGLAFTVPGLYFLARGMIPRRIYPHLGILFSLGLGQGLIGWWMVRSGLNVDPAVKREIRVSPYRLATHLAMAFTTYTGLVYTALEVLHPRESSKAFFSQLSPSALSTASSLRRLSVFNSVLIGVTVMSGAFVAGNDAGRAFNTFPLMDGRWLPQGLFSELSPLWRNLFEHTPTVQFDHRVLALSTLTSICGMFAYARMSPAWPVLPSSARAGLQLVVGMAFTQVGLGITTLLLCVPVSVAAVHQTGALALLTLTTYTAHSLKHAVYTSKHAGAGSAAKIVATSATFLPSKILVYLKK